MIKFFNQFINGLKRIARKRGGLFLLAAILAAGMAFSYFSYLYFVLTPEIAATDFNRLLPISSKIVDREGKLLYEVGGSVQRDIAQSQEIPDIVKQATIAGEDRDFYSHPGINLKSIIRAMLANIRAGGVVEGGSTITQQLIKNTLLTPERTLARKTKEAALAVMLENKLSKDEILVAYLNSVSYGGNIMGVKKASAAIFGKEMKDLNLAEVVTLAALPQAPTALSPYNGNQEALNASRNEILTELHKKGIISDKDLEIAKNTKVEVKPIAHNITAPHFSLMVRDQLIQYYGKDTMEKGGLIIRTTLDSNLQAEAEKIVQAQRRRINAYGASNAGAIIIDPKTFETLALVGSFDYYDNKIQGQVNMGTALRQPGSSFKPIVYATLFSHTNYSPGSIIYDVPTVFPGGYKPNNYTERHYGPLPIRRALAGSLNLPAVKATSLAGVDRVLDTAEDFGYTTLQDRDRFGLSIGLGSGEVKLMEHAAAFGAFANKGLFNPANAILSITDPTGDVLYEFKPAPQQVVPAQVAYQINSILSDNNARTFIFGANSPLAFRGRTVAAKTGTSEHWRDGWTVGYTTSRVVGVWTGNNNGRYMAAGADGVVTAAPLWRALLEKSMSMSGLAFAEFPRPEGLKLVNGEYITDWQAVPTGRLTINSEKPDNPAWEIPVQQYLKKKKEEEEKLANQPPPPEENVGGAPETETEALAPAPAPSPPSEDNPGSPPKNESGISSGTSGSGSNSGSSGEPAPSIQ